MRFLALLKKELREAAPWALLAVVILGGWGWMILRDAHSRGRSYHLPRSGSPLQTWDLLGLSPLSDLGPLLLCCGLGVGLLLALRQFWLPSFFRTWAFTVHRSTSRTQILLAKSAVAMTVLLVGVGGIWTLLFYAATRPEFMVLPPAPRTYWVGWVYIGTGIPAYFATALAGLSTARWYTTKCCPMGLAAMLLLPVILQTELTAAWAILLVGSAVLAAQAAHTFATREF